MDPDFESRANALVAQSDGKIWIESGDRDTETQTRLWNEAVAKYGEEEARNWVAPPGHSNHEKGIAIDFGGDMELLAQLAPQFGLYQPMSWEAWHWEPIGSRGNDPLSYSEKPVNPSALVRSTRTRDYGDVMSQMLNLKPFRPGNSSADISLQRGGTDPIISSNPGFLTPDLLNILGPLTPGPRINVPGRGMGNSVSNRPLSSGNESLDRFMAAIRAVESGGDYAAVNKEATPWGQAKGAYQYLDGTWDNYGGYARADEAPPEIQDQRAREDFQRYYEKYGSWDTVAAIHFSGEGGAWDSYEVQQYVGKVNDNL